MARLARSTAFSVAELAVLYVLIYRTKVNRHCQIENITPWPSSTHPIIQALMAGVSTPELAAAVSNAGGLGSIGIGTSSVAVAQRMIEETHAQTSGVFNVNLLSHVPTQRDAAREAAWLAHLSPFFEEFGAVPPVELKEIHR